MEPIIEIPQAIYDRMFTKSSAFNQVSVADGNLFSDIVKIGVTKVPGSEKHCFVTDYEINWPGSYLIGYYILKDI